MMSVGVFTDLRFTNSDTPTGVGKHIAKMVEGLWKSKTCDLSIIATSDQTLAGQRFSSSDGAPRFAVLPLRLQWKHAEALWTVFNGPSADKYCGDVEWIYCPKNDFIPLKRIKYAVTIHGARELDPCMPRLAGIKNTLNKIRRRLSYRRIVDGADLILVVSQFLKNQVIEWFQAEPSKVVVVGNGIEQVYFDAGARRDKANTEKAGRYLLTVGGLNTLDGGDDILGIARIMLKELPDTRIAVAGWLHEQQYLAQAREMPNIDLLGYVSAPRLAELMRDAIAILFLPKYETFGISGAEAMAVGTPIVTTGGTAIPEIVGEAGIYVQPGALSDAVDRVVQIVRNPQYAASYVLKGRERSRQYTWDGCVKRLIDAMAERS